MDLKDLSSKVISFNLDVLLSISIYCHEVLSSVYVVELHTLILMYKMLLISIVKYKHWPELWSMIIIFKVSTKLKQD